MFFEHLFGEKFKYDFSFSRSKINQFSVLQLSWWNFINIKNKLLDIDAITINHSLNEVSKMAMHYYLSICEKQHKCFSVFIENVGFTSGNNNFNNFFRDSNKYKIYHQNFHGDVEFNENFARGAYIVFESISATKSKLDVYASESKVSNIKYRVILHLLFENIKRILFISFLMNNFISLQTTLRIFIRKSFSMLGLGFIFRPYFYIKSMFVKKKKNIEVSDKISRNLDYDYSYDNYKFSYTYIDVEKYLYKNFDMDAHNTWSIYSTIYDWDEKKHHYNDQ